MPATDEAVELVAEADVLLVVGTSLNAGFAARGGRQRLWGESHHWWRKSPHPPGAKRSTLCRRGEVVALPLNQQKSSVFGLAASAYAKAR